MKCNNCDNDNAQIIQETVGSVQSSSFGKVICTWIICWPWGLYNLVKTKDYRREVNYKYCPDCGSKDRI